MKKLLSFIVLLALTAVLSAQSVSRMQCYAYWEGEDFTEWSDRPEEARSIILIRFGKDDVGITIYEPSATIKFDAIQFLNADEGIEFTALDEANNLCDINIRAITRTDGLKVMMILVYQHKNGFGYGYLGQMVN